MANEVEIKLPANSAPEALALLERHGFLVLRARAFEGNELWDAPNGSLRAKGELLRLRQYAGETVITYKGRSQAGPHKSREEIETTAGSLEAMQAIFQRLGFASTFRYEKYRTEFHRPDEPGHATLDETPIGTYLELEGPADWIDRTAAELGFNPQQYILASYGALYLEHCRKLGIQPTNMIFAGGES